jgi:hypothetical protein
MNARKRELYTLNFTLPKKVCSEAPTYIMKVGRLICSSYSMKI